MFQPPKTLFINSFVKVFLLRKKTICKNFFLQKIINSAPPEARETKRSSAWRDRGPVFSRGEKKPAAWVQLSRSAWGVNLTTQKRGLPKNIILKMPGAAPTGP